MTVTVDAPDENLTPHLVLRHFLVNGSLKVRQLHYTGWPDHDVPSGDSMASFHTMLLMFIHCLLTTDASQKLLVHCSAGVGRTGTTICLAHAIINMWAQKNQGID